MLNNKLGFVFKGALSRIYHMLHITDQIWASNLVLAKLKYNIYCLFDVWYVWLPVIGDEAIVDP